MIRIFRHYVPRVFILLVCFEALMLVASMHVGVALRFSAGEAQPLEPGVVWLAAAIYTGIMLVTIHSMGLYRRDASEDMWDGVFRLGAAFLLGFSLITLVFYAYPPLYVGRGAFGIAFGGGFVALLLARAWFYRWSNQAQWRRRVMVLGAGGEAKRLQLLLQEERVKGFTLVGYVHIDGQQDAVDEAAVLHLGSETSLLELAVDHDVEEVVVAGHFTEHELPVEQLLRCKMGGIAVTQVMTFFEREAGKIRLDDLRRDSVVFSDGFGQSSHGSYVKRAVDLLMSSVLLVVSWPVMLLTALALKIESSKDPVFYKQVRVGEQDQHFEVVKFRSMTVDAEKDGNAQFAQENDPRVTKVGSFIRKTRIDELPQLLNVLRGEMSFVGPRPERPEFEADFHELIPYYGLRHLVKPGITGWAQISYPYGASIEDTRQKLQYDLYYIKNHSTFLDFAIFLQTIYVILWREGAR